MFQSTTVQQRHQRLATGTMVSYAEVKNYLSKREIPQLFESLMAGLMYHRPENHIGYLQTCLDEVRSNRDVKVQWSTFVTGKKRKKSRDMLPPLTPPKKQDSISSGSRQSTPLPPISARGNRDSTYILYHNPPPVLAKPRVPVVFVLGGLGSKIDELCEKVVGRLKGVVHISTCSMLRTRMVIEGFYRITSVPACAVVDSVLQAMSMVHSASALLVAGFPRNRGDIEEYRSRNVRSDGTVLVDFEEEALRRFLQYEVSSGMVRNSDIEMELDRYKQDIISVAEYYDDKELLTVVMGDQDLDDIVDDLVIAVDKIIETRKDEDDLKFKVIDASTPVSTVEITEATEDDIAAFENREKNGPIQDEGPEPLNEANDDVPANELASEDKVTQEDIKPDNEIDQTLPGAEQDQTEDKQETEQEHDSEDKEKVEESVQSPRSDATLKAEKKCVTIVFAFENIQTDYESLQNLIVNELEMCYIDFQDLVKDDENQQGTLDPNETLKILQGVLSQDSHSKGFFIAKFSFDPIGKDKIKDILNLGDVTFVCKVKEQSEEAETQPQSEGDLVEEALLCSSIGDRIRLIFVTEAKILVDLKTLLSDILNEKPKISNEEVQHDSESLKIKNIDSVSKGEDLQSPPKVNDQTGEKDLINSQVEVDNAATGSIKDQVSDVKDNDEHVEEDKGVKDSKSNKEENGRPDSEKLIPSTAPNVDEHEDSTEKDVEDIVSDKTFGEEVEQPASLLSEGNVETQLVADDIGDMKTHETAESNEEDEEKKSKGTLERQECLEAEDDNSKASENQNPDSEKQEKASEGEASKAPLIRQGTFSAEKSDKSKASEKEIEQTDDAKDEPSEHSQQDETTEIKSKEENTSHQEQTSETKDEEDKSHQSQKEETSEIKSHDSKEDKNQTQLEETEETKGHDSKEEKNQTQLEGTEETKEDSKEEEASRQEEIRETEGGDTNEEGKEENQEEKSNASEPKENEMSVKSEEVANISDTKEDKEGSQKEEVDNDDDVKSGESQKVGETSPPASETDAKQNEDDKSGSEKVKSEDQSLEPEREQKTTESGQETETKDPDTSNHENVASDHEKSQINAEIKESENIEDPEVEKDDPSLEKSNASNTNKETDGTTAEVKDANLVPNPNLPVGSAAMTSCENSDDDQEIKAVFETKAEVHAPDCNDDGNPRDEQDHEKDSDEHLISKEESEKCEVENQSKSEDKSGSGADDKKDIDDTKNKSELIIPTDLNTLSSERFSGKRLERNGSGILSDSRENGQHENEEQQERSSSSSRGEL